MAHGDSDKEEDWAPLPLSLAGVRLVDAPVLFLVVSHKAFRAELALVRRTVAEAAEAGVYSSEVVVDLSRRLEFLKLVYNYHNTAEDEVIFLALDAQVKNVAPTYTLEHKSIDDNFSSILCRLDLLKNSDEDATQILQEILFSIGTVQDMICQHMQKEEEQVFPLLKQKFTSEEQSQLVWQYLCSVPVVLLENFLPWMASYLSADERNDVIQCIKHVIPKERLLREVIVSWIEREKITSSHAFCGLQLYPPQFHNEELLKEAGSDRTNVVEGPIKDVPLWHAAVRREFDQIIEELYQIKSSDCFTSLSSVIVQLKFIIDVLIYYSNSLDTIFYPLLNRLAKNSLSPSNQLVDENQIKGLHRLLFFKREPSAELKTFLLMLCKELELFVRGFSGNLIFLEIEVFPFISNNCTREMQLWMLYTSLHVMPLGLLRCTITWFSAHLSENQSTSILNSMKAGCLATNESFTSLLCEWIRIGCSGKTSTEKFRQILEETFNGRSFYLADLVRPEAVVFDDLLKQNIAINMGENVAISSYSVSNRNEECDISHPTEINLHKFFSQMFKRIPSVQNNLVESESPTCLDHEQRPMDHILYIHRALAKDLEYLVTLSAKLASNVGYLAEFEKRFELLHNIYQIHSNTEDEIAFPALESKVSLQNISHSYCIDHKLEAKHFRRTSRVLNEISELHKGTSNDRLKYYQLCLKLHDSCLSMHKVIFDHMYREEVQIFSLFKGCFSIEEEENIVGHMLGRTRAEILQQMIPWLMGYLTSDEQHVVMSLWLKVAKYTNFSHWLGEWWEGTTRYNISPVEKGSSPSPSLAIDPMEVLSKYLLKDGATTQKDNLEKGMKEELASAAHFDHSGSCNIDKESPFGGDQDAGQHPNEVGKKRSNETNDGCHSTEAKIHEKECQEVSHLEHHPLFTNQDELEAIIRRVSRDSTLDNQKKSFIIQNLLMSRWIVKQKMSHQEAAVENNSGEIPGQSPSYRDPLKLVFGCKHYKRNCKLLMPCCNEIYTCIRCHDEETDHTVDRKYITTMMCMACLNIQPISQKCRNNSCGSISMAGYYCSVCKLFDDERQIYHCPYCNLCRVGKGLGIDYFHCMKCNACMSRSLFVHVCREKCLEDNCPICHEYIFTSSSPVKALPCGHLMHSACFQDYTCSHYICPICSKSLGDMQVYFGMLDALLAEEKIPEEYSGQIQIILCNDCEKRGNASFHWLYHKCPYCGSYNTRLL